MSYSIENLYNDITTNPSETLLSTTIVTVRKIADIYKESDTEKKEFSEEDYLDKAYEDILTELCYLNTLVEQNRDINYLDCPLLVLAFHDGKHIGGVITNTAEDVIDFVDCISCDGMVVMKNNLGDLMIKFNYLAPDEPDNTNDKEILIIVKVITDMGLLLDNLCDSPYDEEFHKILCSNEKYLDSYFSGTFVWI